jgi:DNA-binding cell septation regulator SpoVG
MKINNMRMSQSQSKLKAFFDLELDNGIVIKGLKVAEGPTGLFVGMPSEKDQNGKYWDKVYIPKELKEEVNQLALGEYRRLSGGGSSAPSSASSSAPSSAPDSDLPF